MIFSSYETSETVSNAFEQIQSTAYTYDNRGNRITTTGIGIDEYSETYTYDLNNRLTKVVKEVYNEYDHPDNIFSTRYNYDFNGNLFSENVSAIGKSINTPSITMNVFGTGDDNWNHEVGLTIYNYNVNNQLESVVKDGKTATYTYNPDGYRSSKTVDGVTTNHIWNGTQIVLETDSTDDVIAKYIYGNRRIYNEQNGTKSYYLYDAHGDTKYLTNATGGITWDYTYDAFGNEIELENVIPGATANITEPYNPFRYCGEYYDQETGFIYLRARYYSPEIGRFVSEDPAFDGVNWYTYCANNPIIYHDPNGKVVDIIFDIFSLACSANDVISDPTDVWAWVGLVGDVVDLVVPCVSGVGEGVKAVGTAAKAADTVYDTAKAAKAADNVVDTVDNVIDATDNVVDTVDTFTDTTKIAEVASDSTETGVTTKEFLQNAANSVKSPVTGHVSGTKQHTAFKNVVDSAKNDLLETEISFKDGGEVKYGTKGSVRIDVIEYDESGKIIAAYDLKTGSAKLNQKQIDAIRNNTRILDLPVFEIKPQ